MPELAFYPPTPEVIEELNSHNAAAARSGLNDAYRAHLDFHIQTMEAAFRNTEHWAKKSFQTNLGAYISGRNPRLPFAIMSKAIEDDYRHLYPEGVERIGLYRVNLETGQALGGLISHAALRDPAKEQLTSHVFKEPAQQAVVQSIYDGQFELAWEPQIIKVPVTSKKR